MNAIATTLNPPNAPPRRRGKLKLALAPAAGSSPVDAPEPSAIVVPSAPEIVPLRELRRAEENVRHIRRDEDISGLAADIAKHGLLANLIGYRDGLFVMIVGGGRRLQALDALCNDFTITIDFPVPVLVRDREEAIELSLAENLQQRSMSPVDEFMAFRALMERGDTSPAELAKRFGWKERTVRQRLRLAELAQPVLDALAERAITLDAAMAYASSQDRYLQEEVFKAQSKRGEAQRHRPHDVRFDLSRRNIKTDSPLYAFVGAESYERRGGGYEDDLFIDKDAEKTLANPFTLETAAREMIEFQMMRLLPEWQQRADLAPTIDGFVIEEGIKFPYWDVGLKTAAPKGWVKVSRRYQEKDLWKAIRAHRVDVKVLVGVDDKGELALCPDVVFVDKADAKVVEAPRTATAAVAETPEQRDARVRESEILLRARRLAVGPFAGTPFEGRAYWPDGNGWYVSPLEATTIDGVEGQLIAVRIFVTDAEVKAQRAAAEAEYQAELDARAAEEAAS